MFLDGLRKATVTPEELIFGRLRWFFFFFSFQNGCWFSLVFKMGFNNDEALVTD